MKKNILLLLLSLCLMSCNTYSNFFLKDNVNKNNYQIKLLNKNQSIIYLIENEKKIDSTEITYKKESLKLNLSKIKFNSFTQSNKYIKSIKKIKTISFGNDLSNNLHFKFFENTRFAIVNNNLSTIDSIWLKNSEDNNRLK